MPPLPVPLSKSTFSLNSAAVAGFFGGKEAISAMATVHLYRGRPWLGWFNSPGSYTVAKRFGRMANSRFWDGLFPGPNDSPAVSLGLDGQKGPKYIAALSGTKMRTGHLAYLTMERSKRVKAEVIKGKGTARNTQAYDVTYLAMKPVKDDAKPEPEAIGKGALYAIFPIAISVLTCIICALIHDWYSFSMILLGIVSSGWASYAIGRGELVIKWVTRPARGAPAGHGILMGEDGVMVIKGKEEDVNIITKGRFDVVPKHSHDSEQGVEKKDKGRSADEEGEGQGIEKVGEGKGVEKAGEGQDNGKEGGEEGVEKVGEEQGIGKEGEGQGIDKVGEEQGIKKEGERQGVGKVGEERVVDKDGEEQGIEKAREGQGIDKEGKERDVEKVGEERGIEKAGEEQCTDKEGEEQVDVENGDLEKIDIAKSDSEQVEVKAEKDDPEKGGVEDDTPRKYHDIGLSSLLLMLQFLLQLLLIPQARLFGQIMFCVSLGASWIYNSYLSSLEKERIQTDILFTMIGSPEMKRFRANTRTTMTVFTCLLLFHKVELSSPEENRNHRTRILRSCVPNDTLVWQRWREMVVNQLLDLKDKELPHLNTVDEDSALTLKGRQLLNDLLGDARVAFQAYFKHRDSLLDDSSLHVSGDGTQAETS